MEKRVGEDKGDVRVVMMGRRKEKERKREKEWKREMGRKREGIVISVVVMVREGGDGDVMEGEGGEGEKKKKGME